MLALSEKDRPDHEVGEVEICLVIPVPSGCRMHWDAREVGEGYTKATGK